MASEIYELDTGIAGFQEVCGNCWHGLFKDQVGAISALQAQDVLDYRVIKEPLHRSNGDVVEKAFSLVRTDHDKVIYPSVGAKYTIVQNIELLSHLENSLLSKYDGIDIGSVGTLKNGQLAYVDMKIADWAVKGDNSKTVGWLMYSNSFGGRSILTCAHMSRVVCNNTYRLATAQGAANETMKTFRHLAGVGEQVRDYIIELAFVLAELKENKEQLDLMASVSMDTSMTTEFLEELIPQTSENKRGVTLVNNQRAVIEGLFDTTPDLQGAIKHTKYAMFQATTNYADHHKKLRKGQNALDGWWDGLVPGGTRDAFKQRSFSLLCA